MPWPWGSSAHACTVFPRIHSAKPFLPRRGESERMTTRSLRLNVATQSAERGSQGRGADMVSAYWRRFYESAREINRQTQNKSRQFGEVCRQLQVKFRKRTVMKAKTKNSASTSRVRRAFVLMSILLASFALSPGVQAVSPSPDGGYGGN